MKTAVSIPDETFRAAERLAKRMRLSRSRLYARALAAFVTQHNGEGVTEAVNRVCAQVDSSVDPLLAKLQAHALRHSPW